MFGAFNTFGKLGAIGKAIAAAWSPADLTDLAAWYDPSDLSTMFNDSAGTTPVATPGTVADSANPVGLIQDKSGNGHHASQSTSTARPLLSAYDGQTLGPGDTYDATGYPVYLKFDGTDDGIATASFTAGTLTSSMDCLIAVRRDSAAATIVGLLSGPVNDYFGHAESGLGIPCFIGVGTPTFWVDGVQLSGGTSVTANTLNTALTVGDWHIFEARGLDLSLWPVVIYGNRGGSYSVNGANGGILLFESPADPTERDNARAWLAAKVGVTLP